jgi:hypothetical protein
VGSENGHTGDTGDTGVAGEVGKNADSDAAVGCKRDGEDSDGLGDGEHVTEREREDGRELGRKRDREESGEVEDERRVRSRSEKGVKYELDEEGSCWEDREERKVL